MKDYMYMITNDDRVPWKIYNILHILESTWCSLALTGLATQLVHWVKSILSQLIYMFILLIGKEYQ